MSIGKAIGWFFDPGAGRGAEAAETRRRPDREQDCDRDDVAEGRLYGQAEAIRVLYQQVSVKQRPRRPPRSRKRRGLWIARCVGALTSALRGPSWA
jgi:hypothetical protein